MLGPVCLPSQGDIVCQVPIQYSEIIGRESPLHPLQQPHAMLLGQTYRLLASHAPIWSVVQSVTSARSWEELLALHLGSDVGEEEEKGCCTSTSCRHSLALLTGTPLVGRGIPSAWHRWDTLLKRGSSAAPHLLLLAYVLQPGFPSPAFSPALRFIIQLPLIYVPC